MSEIGGSDQSRPDRETSLMTFNMKMAIIICAFTLGFVGAARSGLIFGDNGSPPPGVHVYGPESADSK